MQKSKIKNQNCGIAAILVLRIEYCVFSFRRKQESIFSFSHDASRTTRNEMTSLILHFDI